MSEAEAAEAADATGEDAGAAAGAALADESAEAAPESARSAIMTTTPDAALQFAPEEQEPGAAQLMMQPSETPSSAPTVAPTETQAPTLAPTVTAVPTPTPLEVEPADAPDNSLAGILLIALAALLLILSGATAVRSRRR